LSAVAIIPPDTQGVHFGEENTINAAEVFLAVKTMKTASCYKIRPEMLKALNMEFLG